MLPVEEIIPALLIQLQHGDAIVVAPPGAGKSTRLPLTLLNHKQFKHHKLIMLQPRRMAARSIANYLAHQLGEEVGQTIGYRIRGESKVSQRTRLEIVTEGVLTRMIQHQPDLPEVGLIIFDEFHERSLHADFSLALCLELKEAFNENLKLLVMSATLDTEGVRQIMPDAKVLSSRGRSYPVNIVYRPSLQKDKKLVDQIIPVIHEAYQQHSKDILVFLPGVYEINKLLRVFKDMSEDLLVLPLHSNLKKQAQIQAMQAVETNKRKLILSTNIAETSLTIDGIEVVIDSGVEKTSRFDLRLGVTQLVTQKISQASAEQRAGRAGRLMPGTCYRLWSEALHYRLAKQNQAEIISSDIASLLLESMVWGTTISQLHLIDQPSEAQIAQATELLSRLGVISEQGKLTDLGHEVHKLSTHPTLAVMLLKAKEISDSHLSLACAVCALLESKDPLINHPTPLLEDRLSFLYSNRKSEVWQLINQWHQKFNIKLQTWPLNDLAIIVGLGFPLWLAKKRGDKQFTMANGSGANLHASVPRGSLFESSQWVAIAQLQIVGSQINNTVIRYAQPITMEQLNKHFSSLFSVSERVFWDQEKLRISQSEQTYFGKIKVSKQSKSIDPSCSFASIWLSLIKENGLKFIPLDQRTLNYIQRVNLVSSIDNDIPHLSEAYLIENAEQWLLPSLENEVYFKNLTKLPYLGLIKSLLNYQQQQKLETLLPLKIDLPNGRNASLKYEQDGSVSMSVRMQDLYGIKEHPCVLQGTLPIVCEILSPAQRPIQTTKDIPRFWAGSYAEVKKEMKGRYPKHHWPDDPSNT